MGNAIMWNKGEESLIKVWLQGSTSTTFAPAAGGNWGLGMGTMVGGVGTSNNTNKAKTISQIIELDTTGGFASGYGRKNILRNGTTGWPTTDPAGAGSWSATPSAASSFSFSGTPNPNGATMWFVSASNSNGADNALFGADLSATRTFASGDTENITPTYKQT